MKQLPFNACDYRCDRCLETAQCAVFRQFLEIDRQIQSADAEEAVRTLRESFRETEEAIKEKARRLGIDIDEIAGGRTAVEIRDTRGEGGEDPLLLQCESFRQEAAQFLKSAEQVVIVKDKEYLDDIGWHHTVIPAKMFRATGWRTAGGGEIALDATNSAAVAMKSLTICILALDHLSSRYASLAVACQRLSADASRIKGEIKARFFPGAR